MSALDAFFPCKYVDLTVKRLMREMNVSEKDAAEQVARMHEEEVFRNSTYQVARRNLSKMIHLSIKRIDREPIHDWRDLQEIKNMLTDPEFEAVEIYPAESRRVDSANQYHLWVFPDTKYRLPFGFNERLVTEDVGKSQAKQRPFEKKKGDVKG